VSKSVLLFFSIGPISWTKPSHRANFLFGNVYFDQGRYVEAEKAWELAFRVFSLENEIHPSTTATQMKLASVAMKTGGVEEAMQAKLPLVLHHLCAC